MEISPGLMAGTVAGSPEQCKLSKVTISTGRKSRDTKRRNLGRRFKP